MRFATTGLPGRRAIGFMPRVNPAIAAPLLAWHAHAGRRDLPWQHERSPYRVWVSEIMLQQTNG